MKFAKWSLLTLLPFLAVAAPAKADLLDDVQSRGELVCGTLGTSQPFSFQDASTRQLVGYDIDMCALVADKIGVPVRYQMLAVAARIPELNSGRVDVVAANLGWSPERAEQIDFSHRYYTTPQKLLVLESSDIQTVADLSGRRVGATMGSSSEREMRARVPDANVIGYADSPAAFLSLQQRRIDAQFASELVLVRLRNESPEGSPTRILDEAVFDEPWGLGVRSGEERFLALINETLEEAEESGVAAELYEKWFGQDTAYGLTRSFVIGPIEE